jgi:5-methylcytosine-specific restriction endonuclease McrA
MSASVVDHVIPVTGPDDPRFYVPECHQALCDRCHNVKRSRESRDVAFTSAVEPVDRRARRFSGSHKGGYVVG